VPVKGELSTTCYVNVNVVASEIENNSVMLPSRLFRPLSLALRADKCSNYAARRYYNSDLQGEKESEEEYRRRRKTEWKRRQRVRF